MEVNLSRRSSAPGLTAQDNTDFHDLKTKESNTYSGSFSSLDQQDQSTINSENSPTERKTSADSQDKEDLFKQTISVHDGFRGAEDFRQALDAPNEHRTLFSTMGMVPIEIDKLKENISYYQKKLYQKYSIKVNDLVRLEIIGKGAFGQVSRVFNKTDRKFYALKEVKRDSFKKQIYFESAIWIEVQNLLKVAQLNDPSLLETIMVDFDEEQETCYLLMELGFGTLQELANCMQQNGITWGEKELHYVLSQLIIQVLKLRKHGLVHRDIKPPNVIISTKQDAFKLTDLGCASIVKEGVQKLNITGTPHFMAPELIQAILKKEVIVEHDPFLSDLYSIGITIITLLNPTLKRKDVGNFLENEIKERYPELHPILKDLLSSPEKRKEGVDKTLALNFGITGYSQMVDKDLREKYKLSLYVKIVTSNKDIDTSFYFDLFILDDALGIIKERLNLLKKDKKPEDMNLEEVQWKIRLARCYYLQLNYDAALNELLDVTQRKELKSFDTENVMTKSTALFWLGIVKAQLGKMEDAIDNLMHCLGIRAAEYGEVHEDVSAVFWQLGDTYAHQENFTGAKKALKKCVEIGEKLDLKERKYMAKSLNYLGVLAEAREDIPKALNYYEKAKEAAIVTYGEHHPAVADQFLSIATTYINSDRTEEGLSLCERALDIKIKWYGAGNPEVADAYTKISRVYERLGQYDKVLELLYKSMDIWKKINGEESQELADVYQSIGTVLGTTGQYQESLEYANKVIKIKEKHLGPQNPLMAAKYLWHAETCHELNLRDDKKKSLDKFLAINFDKVELNVDNIRVACRAAILFAEEEEEQEIEKAWKYVQKAYQMIINLAVPKISRAYFFYYGAMGKVRTAEKKYDLALENLKEAISIRNKVGSKDYVNGPHLYRLTANVYEALGQYEKALYWRRTSEALVDKYINKKTIIVLVTKVNVMRALVKLGRNAEAREMCPPIKTLIKDLGFKSNHPLVRHFCQLENDMEGRQGMNDADLGDEQK